MRLGRTFTATGPPIAWIPTSTRRRNAVRALLLIVGLLREEQFWIDEAAAGQATA
jgi:hypothetical protein